MHVEDDYLWYYKQNQDEFRHTSNKLIRTIITNNPNIVGRIARVNTLPTSFIGGREDAVRCNGSIMMPRGTKSRIYL